MTCATAAAVAGGDGGVGGGVGGGGGDGGGGGGDGGGEGLNKAKFELYCGRQADQQREYMTCKLLLLDFCFCLSHWGGE